MGNPHKHILNPKQIADATRWYRSGYKLTHIAELLGVSRNTVTRAIRGEKSSKHRHPWADDIEELRAAGCDEDVILANFGDVL